MTKKKFVLRIDQSTMKAVENWAADEFRSTNGQLEWIITQGLKRAKLYKTPTKKTQMRMLQKEMAPINAEKTMNEGIKLSPR